MPNKILNLLFGSAMALAIVSTLVLQTGCEQREAANRKELGEEMQKVKQQSDLEKSGQNSDSTDGIVEGTPATSKTPPSDSAQSSTNKSNVDSSSNTPNTPVAGSTKKEGNDQETDNTGQTSQNSDSVQESDEPNDEEDAAKKRYAEPTIEVADNWNRLSKDHEIWIDKKAKQVMFTGRICLNAGQLEMFICPERTKEHESVIASFASASKIHMALLLIDCKPGKTSAWDPEYRPAHGPTIDATIKWRDEATGKTKSSDAKQWIRDVDTGKAMSQRWIFGGSEIWKDPETGESVYYGDHGELICLSNFSTATIDVDVKSSQANDGLLFEAFTENIPPVGTKVYTILKPGEIVKPEAKPEKKKKDDTDGPKSDKGEKDEPDEPGKSNADANL